MIDDDFEWDDKKAASNYADHRITFDTARVVFQDSFAIEWLDESERYDEDRYAIIGIVQGRMLHVAYTIRDDRIRIISARGAEPHEQRRYHESNS
jgi:uncharacterized DUF497 family protein